MSRLSAEQMPRYQHDAQNVRQRQKLYYGMCMAVLQPLLISGCKAVVTDKAHAWLDGTHHS